MRGGTGDENARQVSICRHGAAACQSGRGGLDQTAAGDLAPEVEQLCQAEACVARANTLIQAFLALVRERRGDNLEAWISEAIHSVIEELARFARGVQDDLTAIMEAGSPKMTKTGGIMTRMV